MPVVLRIKGFRFYFFSNEGMELKHVHIIKAEAAGKIWLEPFVRPEYYYGFIPKEIKQIEEIVNSHLELLNNAWDEYFEK
jgi:hypothetical protein